LAIAGYAIGGGTAAAQPLRRVPKQIVLTASDIAMYTTIWKIYFGRIYSTRTSRNTEVGLVTVAATGAAYIVTKGSTAILNEITNWAGPVGWGISAVISGSLTGLFGAVWALYCDNLYSQREIQPVYIEKKIV